MKVLFISNIPVPYRVDFYNELGKNVDLTVLFEAKGASDQGIRFNYNLETIKNFKAIFLSEGDIREKTVDFRIFKYLREPYDRIVLTSYSYFTEMAALLYLKLKKIPYYLSSDGGLIKEGEPIWKRKYKTFLISGAIGYFSPSQMTDSYLVYYGAPKSAIYRYPFTSYKKEQQLTDIIPDSQKAILKKELNIQERYLVLGVGQFIHRKGWDLLLRAMCGMPDDVALCLIGGRATEEYKKIVSDNNLKHVYFMDFMGNEELARYYKAADVFVLPTREDIWGLVINEAMNYGLPVITTNACVAGLELVKNGANGFIVGGKNNLAIVNSLRHSLNMILNESVIRIRMQQNSSFSIKNYTIEHTAEVYCNILSEEEDSNESN